MTLTKKDEALIRDIALRLYRDSDKPDVFKIHVEAFNIFLDQKGLIIVNEQTGEKCK